MAANEIVTKWHTSFGGDLTPEDYKRLESRWITPELAVAAGLRRVGEAEGREVIGLKGDMSGLLIPNITPATGVALLPHSTRHSGSRI